MGSRRFLLASLSAILMLAATTTPALGKNPDPGVSDDRPLTAQEQAASDRKAAGAERYAASFDRSGSDLAPLGCVILSNPEPMLDEAGGGAVAQTGSSTLDAEGAQVSPLSCTVPQGFISVEARDQIFGHYCGPAVGQVIANYSWGMASGVDKYSQRKIAEWMSTDALGQTTAFTMEAGLERATAGSPRRPAGWDWIVTELRDTDGDGLYGDQLYAYVRSNISNSRMPLAIPVKPHDAKSPSDSNLSSWPVPVASVGHWVSIYGWVGVYDGTDGPRMYFTDSSRDEGGATGKFWTPTRRFAFLILEHTRRFVW